MSAPLEDPNYDPVHKPVNGRVPDVVRKWGKKSQLRWFHRFRNVLRGVQDYDGLWTSSEHHAGWCCTSCLWEEEEGSGVCLDGWCCCEDSRITAG